MVTAFTPQFKWPQFQPGAMAIPGLQPVQPQVPQVKMQNGMMSPVGPNNPAISSGLQMGNIPTMGGGMNELGRAMGPTPTMAAMTVPIQPIPAATPQPAAQPTAAGMGANLFAGQNLPIILGTLAGAIGGNETAGGRIGQAVAGLGSQMNNQQAVNAAMQGQQVPGLLGVDPQALMQVAQMAENKRQFDVGTQQQGSQFQQSLGFEYTREGRLAQMSAAEQDLQRLAMEIQNTQFGKSLEEDKRKTDLMTEYRNKTLMLDNMQLQFAREQAAEQNAFNRLHEQNTMSLGWADLQQRGQYQDKQLNQEQQRIQQEGQKIQANIDNINKSLELESKRVDQTGKFNEASLSLEEKKIAQEGARSWAALGLQRDQMEQEGIIANGRLDVQKLGMYLQDQQFKQNLLFQNLWNSQENATRWGQINNQAVGNAIDKYGIDANVMMNRERIDAEKAKDVSYWLNYGTYNPTAIQQMQMYGMMYGGGGGMYPGMGGGPGFGGGGNSGTPGMFTNPGTPNYGGANGLGYGEGGQSVQGPPQSAATNLPTQPGYELNIPDQYMPGYINPRIADFLFKQQLMNTPFSPNWGMYNSMFGMPVPRY